MNINVQSLAYQPNLSPIPIHEVTPTTSSPITFNPMPSHVEELKQEEVKQEEERATSPASMNIGPVDINALINSIGQLAHSIAMSQPTGNNNQTIGHLNIKLPIYKGELGENIQMWTLQCITIFAAQNITDDTKMIHYASTALEGGALYWYFNKVTAH